MDTEAWEKSLIEWTASQPDALATAAQIPDWLINGLLYLLENRFQDLLQLLYRRDVNEDKVKEIFAGRSSDDIAKDLAKLIIERELLRQKIRKQYSQGKGPTSLPPLV